MQRLRLFLLRKNDSGGSLRGVCFQAACQGRKPCKRKRRLRRCRLRGFCFFNFFCLQKKLKKSKTLDKTPSFKSTNLIRKYTTSVGGWVIIGEKAIKKKITKRSRCRSTRQKGFFACLSGSRCLSGSVERLGKKAPAARFSLGFFF